MGASEPDLERERNEILEQVEALLETPVRILGFVWLALLVVEFLFGESRSLTIAVYAIWAIFLLDFAIRFTLAPRKGDYLRRNWLTVLSLALPALRVFAVFRALRVLRLARTARVARSLRLVKVLGSLNRGMRALRGAMQRRGFGYISLLTLVVVLVGAAGMYVFEGPPSVQDAGANPSSGFNESFADYGDALWWTAMIMTTLGSEGWPQTAEGRILGVVLSLYAFAVFGYATATLASFFIGRDVQSIQSEEVGVDSEVGLNTVEALRMEIQALRKEVRSLRDQT